MHAVFLIVLFDRVGDRLRVTAIDATVEADTVCGHPQYEGEKSAESMADTA